MKKVLNTQTTLSPDDIFDKVLEGNTFQWFEAGESTNAYRFLLISAVSSHIGFLPTQAVSLLSVSKLAQPKVLQLSLSFHDFSVFTPGSDDVNCVLRGSWNVATTSCFHTQNVIELIKHNNYISLFELMEERL